MLYYSVFCFTILYFVLPYFIALCFIVVYCILNYVLLHCCCFFLHCIKYSSILYSLKIGITRNHNCNLNNGDNDNGDGDDGGDGDDDADDEIMPAIASIGTFRAVSKFITVKFHSMKLSFFLKIANMEDKSVVRCDLSGKLWDSAHDNKWHIFDSNDRKIESGNTM